MSEDIAQAIHQALAAHSLILDHFGSPPRLYDSAPEDPVFPYLSYGRMRSEDISGDAASLHSHQLTLHIWSRYNGRAETVRLMDILKAVLSDSDYIAAELNSESLISATVIFSDILRAPDGRTHHGLLRLSVLTETP